MLTTEQDLASPVPARAGRREWTGLAVLVLPTLLISVDVTVLYLALPQLSSQLGASSTQQLWIMDIYGFMLSGLLVTMGTLGDRIGRRKLLLVGAAGFCVASVVAAYSRSPEMLIAARAALGIAGATLMPSTLALISNMFQAPGQRSVAIAVWLNCFLIGMVIAPLLGGWMLEHFWWGAALLLGVPVMVVLLLTAPVLLPEYRDASAGRLELTSVVLSLAAILPTIYGIKELARHGWQVEAFVALVVGLGMGVVFVRRQLTLEHPLLDPRLFANRAFSATLLILLLVAIVTGGMGLLVPLYLQMVAGRTPLEAGMWMVPQMLGMMVGSSLGPFVVRRMRPGYVMAAGLALSSVGYLVMSQVDSVGGPVVLVIGSVIVTMGLAPMAVLGTDLVVGSVPPEKAGSAASTSETANELGVALGVAILGSFATAIYRRNMADAVPAGVPDTVAASVRESIIGAVTSTSALPAELRDAVLAPARESFTQGINIAAGLGVVVFATLAVLAAVTLKHVRAGQH
ncbi:MFS transporter [Myxococcus sp. XM-1-1-1]|uniref:MFS transporter n=1 Tax=Myxococcus sp. XM-1-1-1 TaxID=2874602 RepID=UPI001CBBF950|nr:MFS transporter [Myxococcus sp. XM-1-1-1]MBZ4409727.1 MFS transporter [Myxococcus sp. XM-1-1-1]